MGGGMTDKKNFSAMFDREAESLFKRSHVVCENVINTDFDV